MSGHLIFSRAQMHDLTNLSRAICGLVLIVVLTLSAQAHGHGLHHERIEDISERLHLSPDNADLYLKRGRIKLDAEQWQSALADFTQAWRKANTLSEALYWQGYTWYKLGDLKQAQQVMQAYLARAPQAPMGHRTMAAILAAQHRHTGAARHYDLAIRYDDNAPPQVFLDRAKAQFSRQPLDLAAIEAGMAEAQTRFGILIAHIDWMTRQYEQREQPRHALAWLRKLPEPLAASPKWLLRKAELHHQAHDRNQARRFWRLAIASLDALPARKRALPANRALRQQAERALAQRR